MLTYYSRFNLYNYLLFTVFILQFSRWGIGRWQCTSTPGSCPVADGSPGSQGRTLTLVPVWTPHLNGSTVPVRSGPAVWQLTLCCSILEPQHQFSPLRPIHICLQWTLKKKRCSSRLYKKMTVAMHNPILFMHRYQEKLPLRAWRKNYTFDTKDD